MTLNVLQKKYIVVGVVAFVLLAGGLWVFLAKEDDAPTQVVTAPKVDIQTPTHTIIGSSVEKRPIDAYTYGQGKTHLMFVGGIHGGYEWNSVLLAYTFMDYLDAHPEVIHVGTS